MNQTLQELYATFRGLPEHYNAVIIALLAIFLANQSLELGRKIGAFAYGIIN